VCGCKKLKCVIAKTAGLFLWLQKRKRKTEPVFDCNYLAWVIATRNYVRLQKETWLCPCGWKATWLFGIWLQACVVCDCKNCWFISVTAKKKKKNWTSAWLQLFCVRDCNQELSVVAKKENLTLCVWLKSYLVIWNMIASLGSVWLQKTAGSFLWLQKPYFVCFKCFFIRLWCRKAEQTREDRDGDIEKLFQFLGSVSRTTKHSTVMLILTQRRKC
jgi:hypothetical protein